MIKLSPSDSLWLAILERDPSLKDLDDVQVRQRLKDGEFPQHVIEAFIKARINAAAGSRSITR